eukprot:maker-scaffold_1-snap-gene-7.38-mRNA-1 protein AED:0.12 eAED:0.12 QI:79/0.5/0.33/1/1/1/3/0/125
MRYPNKLSTNNKNNEVANHETQAPVHYSVPIPHLSVANFSIISDYNLPTVAVGEDFASETQWNDQNVQNGNHKMQGRTGNGQESRFNSFMENTMFSKIVTCGGKSEICYSPNRTGKLNALVNGKI